MSSELCTNNVTIATKHRQAIAKSSSADVASWYTSYEVPKTNYSRVLSILCSVAVFSFG